MNSFKVNDYYRYDYTIADGESATIRFVLRKDSTEGAKSYMDALCEMTAFWQNVQSQVRLLPNAEGKLTENMFRQNITVMLQMMQRYENSVDPDMIFARQGDVGRFIWIWEAVPFLTLLERVGLSAYVNDA